MPGLGAGPCTSSQLPCRGSPRILLCWSPSCARDVGVYCSFVGLVFALVWFWPVPGMWAVFGSLFLSFCCVYDCWMWA